MIQKVLITGGSGLIGRPLTRMLLKKGYAVNHLSRNPSDHGNPKLKIFRWNVEKREIDEDCIKGVSSIIHLAGEGIAEKRWTSSRKAKIISSRVESTALIFGLLKRTKDHQVRSFISSSAIGFYGDRKNEILTEDSKAGKGFLPRSTILWEEAVTKGEALGLRIVKLRTGIVLSDQGGALPEMAAPIKKGLGSPLGTGEQWLSWIHIHDVVRMYVFALENQQLSGTYNMTSANPVRNEEMTNALAAVFQKNIILPKVPAFALKLLLGEMSALVLDSAKVSSEKIINEGFTFDYPYLKEALREIYEE